MGTHTQHIHVQPARKQPLQFYMIIFGMTSVKHRWEVHRGNRSLMLSLLTQWKSKRRAEWLFGFHWPLWARRNEKSWWGVWQTAAVYNGSCMLYKKLTWRPNRNFFSIQGLHLQWICIWPQRYSSDRFQMFLNKYSMRTCVSSFYIFTPFVWYKISILYLSKYCTGEKSHTFVNQLLNVGQAVYSKSFDHVVLRVKDSQPSS